ncbi:hypothetical protein GCK72_020770 [Caenorhabditis remanei]|nr:hypothetical protein GCK72_020770 [Caenorhabditis remanei]KAF1754210.1 hypothetical protein GCK72_020770 [Caenorhabditis remanei]
MVKQKGLDKNEKIKMLEKLLDEKENVIKELAEKHQRDQEERIAVLKKLLEEKDDVIKQQEERLEEHTVRIRSLQIDQQETPDENPEKIPDALYKLQAINGVLHRQQPISKCTETTNRVIINTNKKEIRRIAETERTRFWEEPNAYSETVENRIAMIQYNQFETADEIPALPNFPVFSPEFLKVYEVTMKSKPPLICSQLQKTSELNPEELEDDECVICLDLIELEDETEMCGVCNSHKKCIQDWMVLNRTCPSCRAGIVDNREFPSLG